MKFKALCVILLISTALSVRSLSNVLKSLQLYLGLFEHKTPSHTSCRRWLNQVGYYMLEVLPVEQANDWIFIVDNSIRIENRKLCLVLGVQRSQLKKGTSLSFKDVRVINMRLLEKNKEVENVLEEGIKKAGKPISICSDRGPDVMPRVKAIMEKYEGIKHISDMTHKAGNLLKKHLETDKNWKRFIAHINQSKNRLKQSSLSFLCPPNVRGKSRFLNCKDVVIWALRIIQMFESTDKKDPDYEMMQEKLGWVRKEKKNIEYFFELFELAAIAKELTRKLHVDKKVWKYAKDLLEERSSSKGKKFVAELVAFLKEQGENVEEGMCLLGCTEIIESAMSKGKLLDRECGSSGYTKSILGLAACFGPIDPEMIARALETVTEKDVAAWEEKHIGETTQNKRREVLKNLDREKLVIKTDRFIERKTMVS